MTTLVVYFSLTGNTQRLAEEIAEQCPGNLDRIEETRSRKGVLGYLGAARDSWRKRKAEIQPTFQDPSDYDLVVVGTPVWAWGPTPAIRSYLAMHRSHIKRVAFFCTMGGSGSEGTFRQMSELCGKQPVATLAVSDADAKRPELDAKVRAFVDALAKELNS